MLFIKLINVVLPVFIIITMGYLFGRHTKVDSKPLAMACLYLFNPALYFNSMVKSTLTTAELLKVFWFTVILFLIFAIILKIVARIMHYDQKMSNALMLSSGFPNSGNYGLPIMLLCAATPTAATTTLLAVQFDTKPELVSTVTFTTTAASLLTVSFVLSKLM